MGWGGISAVAEATGISDRTIRNGIRELADSEALPLDRESRVESVVWYNFWVRAMGDPFLARRQRAFHRRWIRKAEAVLKSVQHGVPAELRIDIEEEAELLSAVVNGIGLRATLDPRAWPASRQVRVLKGYLSRLMPRAIGRDTD